MPGRLKRVAVGLACALPLMMGLIVPGSAQERLPWQDRGEQRSYEPRDVNRDYQDRRSEQGIYDSRDTAAGAGAYGAAAPYGQSGGYASRSGGANDAYSAPRNGGYAGNERSVGQPYGEPYRQPAEPSDRGYGSAYPAERNYDAGPRQPSAGMRPGTYSSDEIASAGHRFFGKVSSGLASAIEYAFKRQGRPNGYILGEDAGGAFVAGLRYGEGVLYTKDAGEHKVFWQGPSVGYDFGGEGSKVMVLVYNLRDPSEIYDRFGGIAGSAYVVGGVGLNFQTKDHIVLAPIRAGVGLRLGANIGYLKYTPRPTWNPF